MILVFSLGAIAQDLEDLLSFKAHALDADYPKFSLTQAKLQKFLDESLSTNYGEMKTVFKVEKVNSLPNGALYSMKPVLDGKNTYIRIAVTNAGLKSAGASMEFCNYAVAMTSKFKNSLGWMETITNARMGSNISLHSLAELRLHAISDLQYNFYISDLIEEAGTLTQLLKENHAPKLEADFKDLEKLARDDLKTKKAKFEARKVIFDELDTSSNQFKDLIAKNDRKGVAKLVESYLPWEYMEPVEVKYWTEWLDAVRNPIPMEERMFMYRGLDKGQSFINDAGKAYLMPPVIIKNQGTYNRRLRSLTTMLDKSISENPQLRYSGHKSATKIMSRSSRVANQLENHASDPMGSPHMSFTKDISTAQTFGEGKIGVFAIDPRLITPNAMSGFQSEVELLASLAVFPDESLGIIDSGTNYSYVSEEELSKKAKAMIEEHLGSAKAAKIWKREFSDKNPLFGQESFPTEARLNYIDWLQEATKASCSHHLSN